MVPRRLRFLPVVMTIGAGVWTAAQAQLATNSPFLPPQGAAQAGPAQNAPLQFGGYIETAEGMLFRVIDPARKTGVWVKMNERDPTLDVAVRQHDPSQNTLTVEHQGRSIVLAGRESKVASSGNAPQPVPMPAATNVAPAVTQSVVVNPTPADEQRRLEAVAAEVARRRALREQAAQQISQGVPPQIPPPQGQPMQLQPARSAQPPPAQTNRQRR